MTLVLQPQRFINYVYRIAEKSKVLVIFSLLGVEHYIGTKNNTEGLYGIHCVDQ